mmetsp:Transcript_30167/g.64461  ORF Transcript_30167/g.64461 Transcript_30167/m.64461 type:complete len:89 (+) Transcript_30167:940-1206(+)
MNHQLQRPGSWKPALDPRCQTSGQSELSSGPGTSQPLGGLWSSRCWQPFVRPQAVEAVAVRQSLSSLPAEVVEAVVLPCQGQEVAVAA